MKKMFVIFCISLIIILSSSSQACETSEKEYEKPKTCDESYQKESDNSFNLEELSFIFAKLSTFYDKLVDRFPIIEKIMEKIFFWIYLQISNMEEY